VRFGRRRELAAAARLVAVVEQGGLWRLGCEVWSGEGPLAPIYRRRRRVREGRFFSGEGGAGGSGFFSKSGRQGPVAGRRDGTGQVNLCREGGKWRGGQASSGRGPAGVCCGGLDATARAGASVGSAVASRHGDVLKRAARSDACTR
jgi:hypothetical protein